MGTGNTIFSQRLAQNVASTLPENLQEIAKERIAPQVKQDTTATELTEEQKNLPDYSFNLRLLAQQKKQSEKAAGQSTPLNTDHIPMINDLLSETALRELNSITIDIEAATRNAKGERVFFSFDDHEELVQRIDIWLKENLNAKAIKEGEKESQAHINYGDAWIYFESLAQGFNGNSMTSFVKESIENSGYKDFELKQKRQFKKALTKELKQRFRIKDPEQAKGLVDVFLLYEPLAQELEKFTKEKKFDGLDSFEQGQEKSKFVKKLSVNYPYSSKEINAFFDIFVELKTGKNPIEVFKEVNKRYKLTAEHKVDMLIPWAMQTVGDGLALYAPFAMATSENFSEGIMYHLTFMALAVATKQGSSYTMSRFLNKLNKKMNRDVDETLFYGQFQDISRKSTGKIIQTTETGTEAIMQSLISAKELSSLLIQPTGALALLMWVNPVLGLTCMGGFIGSAGVAYGIGRLTNEEHKKETLLREEALSGVDHAMKSMQELRLSPKAQVIQEDLTDRKDKADDSLLKKNLLGAYMGLGTSTSGMGAMIATAMLGNYLKIPAKTLMSVFLYTGQVINPLTGGIATVTDTLTKDVHNSNRLLETLGNRENVVLPGSEVEENRIPVSELKDFTLRIKGLNYKNILKDINLEVEEGDFVTITGPSGIGKSTLVKTIAGLLKQDSGEVTIGDTDIQDIKKYDPDENLYWKLAYADQKPGLIKGMTLRQNLLLGIDNADDEQITDVMMKLGLYKEGVKPSESDDPTLINLDLGDTVTHDFSGGQLVRLGLARALLRNPRIMLLDEPSASLDPKAAGDVRKLLMNIKRENPELTIICVTHDQKIIEECQRGKDKFKCYDLSKNINSKTPDSIIDSILQAHPEQPEDLESFFRDGELEELTDLDFYDLRSILLKEIQEEELYARRIWSTKT